YLNLSSADRNRNLFPDSADSELSFDEQSNVLGLKILNFEIPLTRYPIDKTSNNLYISEKRGEDEYYFYSLRASTGGHSIQNLAVSLTLSAKCPVMFTGDKNMGNDYKFSTSLLFGKLGVISTGEYEYTIHAASETVALSGIVVNSDTEAKISFLASSEQVFKPGALLVFKPYTYRDRDVQVVEAGALSGGQGNEVRVMGDFSDLDWENLSLSSSKLVPYSGFNSVASVIGFGSADIADQSMFEVLAIASPFATNDILRDGSVMVTTNFAPFWSKGSHVRLHGAPGFMESMVCEVASVHDETHAEIYVERSVLWSHDDSATLANPDDPSQQWGVVDIHLSNVFDGLVELTVSLDAAPAPSTLTVGDVVIFSGFHAPEFQELGATVVDVQDEAVALTFEYPAKFLLEEGVTSLCPVNPYTGICTTSITPYRFDLSRGRRMVLCRAVVDNQDVGSIHIPSLSTRVFFGRIQLFSGANLVNFLGAETAVGSHEFNSVLKRLSKIRFQFFNEDGTAYDFVGVDYTMFLELTCLDSNKGI
ncbi:unnamed protein product, partial [Ectocarpus sp. 12 AP-2014]